MDLIYIFCCILLTFYIIGLIAFKSHQFLYKFLINLSWWAFFILSSIYFYLYTQSIIYTIIYISALFVVNMLLTMIIASIRAGHRANKIF